MNAMKARTLSIVASLGLAATSLAQLTATAEQRVQEVFANLRGSSTLWLRTDATQTIGQNTSVFASDLFYAQRIGALPTIELLDYRGSNLAHRVVADSVVLWAYDPRRNEYSTARYGVYSGNPPATALGNLLQSVGSMVTSPSSYAARLLREVYGGEAAMYRHWVTGNTPVTVDTVNPVYIDPIAGRTFTAGPDLEYVVFTQGNPVRRSAIFERARTNTGIWNLSGIWVTERDDLAGRQRVLDLKVTPYPDQIPNTANFVFTPPQGARPVTRTRPGG